MCCTGSTVASGSRRSGYSQPAPGEAAVGARGRGRKLAGVDARQEALHRVEDLGHRGAEVVGVGGRDVGGRHLRACEQAVEVGEHRTDVLDGVGRELGLELPAARLPAAELRMMVGAVEAAVRDRRPARGDRRARSAVPRGLPARRTPSLPPAGARRCAPRGGRPARRPPAPHPGSGRRSTGRRPRRPPARTRMHTTWPERYAFDAGRRARLRAATRQRGTGSARSRAVGGARAVGAARRRAARRPLPRSSPSRGGSGW